MNKGLLTNKGLFLCKYNNKDPGIELKSSANDFKDYVESILPSDSDKDCDLSVLVNKEYLNAIKNQSTEINRLNRVIEVLVTELERKGTKVEPSNPPNSTQCTDKDIKKYSDNNREQNASGESNDYAGMKNANADIQNANADIQNANANMQNANMQNANADMQNTNADMQQLSAHDENALNDSIITIDLNSKTANEGVLSNFASEINGFFQHGEINLNKSVLTPTNTEMSKLNFDDDEPLKFSRFVQSTPVSGLNSSSFISSTSSKSDSHSKEGGGTVINNHLITYNNNIVNINGKVAHKNQDEIENKEWKEKRIVRTALPILVAFITITITIFYLIVLPILE